MNKIRKFLRNHRTISYTLIWLGIVESFAAFAEYVFDLRISLFMVIGLVIAYFAAPELRDKI